MNRREMACCELTLFKPAGLKSKSKLIDFQIS